MSMKIKKIYIIFKKSLCLVHVQFLLKRQAINFWYIKLMGLQTKILKDNNQSYIQ